MNVTFENSFIVMPADCNYQHGPNGAMMIFGGAFMSQLDLCAASCVNQLLLGTECDSAVTYKVLDGTFHLACESGDIVFMKATSCIQGPNDDVMLPKGSVKSDWEVELGIVIGTEARHVSQKAALDHVAGYCLINDVSEREYQLERGGTWDKGKGCDTFGPIGPWLVTRDEVANPQKLSMWLDVNGVRMQTGNTKTMIFGVAKIVSYLSQFMTLKPGDVICTGTPPGVGMGVKKDGKPAPVYLKRGDVMTLGIEGLGEQHQKVVAFKL